MDSITSARASEEGDQRYFEGGYGALRSAFAHPELFRAVSAQSPALITESPQQLDSAAHSGSPLVAVLGPVFGRPIDVSHWNANNPFLLAKRNAAGLRRLSIYFNCGEEDSYGLEKGPRRSITNSLRSTSRTTITSTSAITASGIF